VIDAVQYKQLNALNRDPPVDFVMRKVAPASAMALKEHLAIDARVTMLVRLHFAVISTLPTLLLLTKRTLVLEENTPFHTTRNATGAQNNAVPATGDAPATIVLQYLQQHPV